MTLQLFSGELGQKDFAFFKLQEEIMLAANNAPPCRITAYALQDRVHKSRERNVNETSMLRTGGAQVSLQIKHECPTTLRRKIFTEAPSSTRSAQNEFSKHLLNTKWINREAFFRASK